MYAIRSYYEPSVTSAGHETTRGIAARTAKQRLHSFLLRNDLIYSGKKKWIKPHFRITSYNVCYTKLLRLMPVGAGAVVMLLVALLINNIPKKRSYPEFWF